MTQQYLKVTPSDDQYEPAVVPDVLRGLRDVSNPEPEGLTSKLNPFNGATIPRFEFTALSAGEDAPVEFYYGVEERHLETLKTRLTDLYPWSFDIEVVDVDLAQKLVQPVEYDPDEFLTALENGDLWVDETDLRASEDEVASDGRMIAEGDPDSGTLPSKIRAGIDSPEAIPGHEPLTTLDSPTEREDGRIYARPAVDEVLPKGYRWHGSSERKQDWMCQLTTYTEATGANRPQSSNREGDQRSPLAGVIDRLGAAEIPLGFQVVFRKEPSWKDEALLRIDDLRHRRDTRFERIEGFIWNTDLEKRDLDDLPPTYQRRIGEIKNKDAKFTFAATVRALTVDPIGEDRDPPRDLERLTSLLSELEGEFYSFEQTRFRQTGFRKATKDKHARKAFERFQNRELLVDEDDDSDRPQLILNADELASFVTVPSAEELSVDARRETEAEAPSRTPLARPHPRLLHQFDEGMTTGLPLNEVRETAGPPVRVPPDLLTLHAIRLATSGHGKSVAVINDLLSIHESTGGPSVLLDPKGDGMCRNYMRAHYAEYGNLDDVIYFRGPKMLPTIPFFDIRPALATGQDWETAVQDRVEHFRELLRLIMGEETHDRAYLANDILGFLIKAMFDPEHGRKVFGIDDLYHAVLRMQRDEVLPPVSIDYIEIEETLANFFEKSPQTIENTLTAMEGRVNKIKDQLHVYRMLSTTPEWDSEREEYVGDVFDFRQFLDEDVVILFDLGGLRSRGQQTFSMALLSNMWNAIKPRGREDKSGTDYPLVNLIMEEAAPLAASPLMYEELIPQGRSFGIGLEFVMQYPEQVDKAGGQEGGQRAYDELLNNIGTTIVGNIDKQEELADAVAGGGVDAEEIETRIGDLPDGEWIVDLPNPVFRETGAAPFSVASMPIPEGHPDNPLNDAQQRQFKRDLKALKRAVADEYGYWGNDDDDDDGDEGGDGAQSGVDDGDGGDSPAATNDDVSGESEVVASIFGDDDDNASKDTNSERTASDDQGAAEEGGSTESSPTQASSSVDPGESSDEGDVPDRSASELPGERASETESGGIDAGRKQAMRMFEKYHEDSPGPSGEENSGVDPDSLPDAPGDRGTDPEHVESPPAERDQASPDVEELDPGFDGDHPPEFSGGRADGDDSTPDAGGDKNLDARSDDENGDHSLASDPAEAPDAGNTEEQRVAPAEVETEPVEPAPDLFGSAVPEDDAGGPDEDLSHLNPEQRLLKTILDAMNRELADYSLVESMTTLEKRHEDADIDRLLDEEYLEKHSLGSSGWKYYTVLPKGRRYLRESVRTGEGVGDLGEKTPHKVGVELLRHWMTDQEPVAEVAIYHNHEDIVFDVAGFDDEGSLVWVGEVETESNDRESVRDDYEKMAATEANAIWLFGSRQGALDSIAALADADLLPERASGRDARSYSAIQDWAEELDAPGMTTTRGYSDLFKELDT